MEFGILKGRKKNNGRKYKTVQSGKTSEKENYENLGRIKIEMKKKSFFKKKF